MSKVAAAGEVEFIYIPSPSTTGRGSCIIRSDKFFALTNLADLEYGGELGKYVDSLEADEPIAIEVNDLGDADVKQLTALARASSHDVFVRKLR